MEENEGRRRCAQELPSDRPEMGDSRKTCQLLQDKHLLMPVSADAALKVPTEHLALQHTRGLLPATDHKHLAMPLANHTQASHQARETAEHLLKHSLADDYLHIQVEALAAVVCRVSCI